MDQHANAFRAKGAKVLIETEGVLVHVPDGAGRDKPRLKDENGNFESSRNNRKEYFKATGGEPVGQRPTKLLTGQALKDWIKEKGFNGVTTTKQRAHLQKRQESTKNTAHE